MKNYSRILIFFLLSFYSCNKEDNLTPEEQLPPATETGEGIFACLINGELFIDTGGGYFNCFYQNVNGNYYFHLQGENFDENMSAISLGTINKPISEGENYNLLEESEGNATASIFFLSLLNSINTSSTHTGNLHISKLDLEKRIVSGTFEFDIVHPETGEIIEVRKGRFDTLFTQ